MGSKASDMSLADEAKKYEDSKYVKVHMEDDENGRNINVKAHDSYESLFEAVKKMFDDFSDDYLKDPNGSEQEEVVTPNHVLIYEDDKGNLTIVHKVPWEFFISSVKILYIVRRSSLPLFVTEEESSSSSEE